MKPIQVSGLAELSAHTARWRAAGERLALVPTMGNLHRGHLALVEAARRRADRVVVSIFVNPTQFGPGEDYERYPRTLAADLEALASVGCDLAWVPEVRAMYPLAHSFMLKAPEPLAGKLCGACRPGHFDGVVSVVLRLFNQVGPDLALFGEKDFQQLLLIRRMVEDLALPLAIEALPTVREDDGLAMSSRNQYLAPEQRRSAPLLHRTLARLAASLAAGDADWAGLRASAWSELESAGFSCQYLEWVDAETLADPVPGQAQRLLAAALLGPARLIDNLPVPVRQSAEPAAPS